MNPTFKTYQFPVVQRGQLVSPDFDLDKNVGTITALALDSNQRGTLFKYGTQRIEVGGLEIFPENFRSNLLMFGITAARKFYEFKEALKPGTGKLRFTFKDTADPAGQGQNDGWQPYVVFITIEQSMTR